MAILRLEFDIDGDVYPELLTALSAITTDVSRAERLRQLAATGLIWEAVRLHGHPASLPSAPPEPRVAPPPPARKATKAAPKSAPRRAPLAASPSDFVDLAIDAPALQARDVEVASRHLPILMDVVDASITSAPGAMEAPKPAAQAMDPFEPSADDMQLSVAAPTPAKRSRLMRMKEKGLFKNG